MKILRGDIILVHTPVRRPMDIICWLIRKITGSYWNHVVWVLDTDLLIESQGGEGVHLSPPECYDLDDPDLTKVVRIKNGLIPENDLTNALLVAQRAVGRRYDWWLILQLLWLYLFGERKRKEAGDWDNEWICSELLAKPLWEKAAFKFLDDVPVDNIVPGDIEKSPYVEEVRL